MTVHAAMVDAETDPGTNSSPRFSVTRRVRLGDASLDGRLRLDALARYLQDIAFDANHHSGVAGVNWVVRRVDLACGALPTCTDVVELTTWVSGLGARWAERRTSLRGPSETWVEARVLWVYLDPLSGTAAPLPDEFVAGFPGGRTVTSRLRHARPPADVDRRPWCVRVTDLDFLGHMNNAAYWDPLEDELARRRLSPAGRIAELEFRAPVTPESPVTVLTAGDLDAWIVGPDDIVFASARFLPAPARPTTVHEDLLHRGAEAGPPEFVEP